jgi:hypothetical protein
LQSTGLERDNSIEELADIALKLWERVNLSPHQRYRLEGVGLSNFREAERSKSQLFLFRVTDAVDLDLPVPETSRFDCQPACQRGNLPCDFLRVWHAVEPILLSRQKVL